MINQLRSNLIKVINQNNSIIMTNLQYQVNY